MFTTRFLKWNTTPTYQTPAGAWTCAINETSTGTIGRTNPNTMYSRSVFSGFANTFDLTISK